MWNHITTWTSFHNSARSHIDVAPDLRQGMTRPMRLWLILTLLVACALPAWPVCAREAGWVPIPSTPWKPTLAPGAAPAKKKAIRQTPVKATPPGQTVYDKQPLITENELGNFIPLMAQFRIWARNNNESAHPIVNASGRPDFQYSANAAAWVRDHGFDPARFFCIMGRMAAGVVIIEEGNDLSTSRPRDMPAVDQQEVALARRHLGELLTAASQPGR